MSVARHQSTAADLEIQSATHAARSAPVEPGTLRNCGGSSPASDCGLALRLAREEEAARLSWLAARDREAAEVLALVEESACGTLAEAERDASPFARGAIVSVAPWVTLEWTGGRAVQQLGGATIALRPAPGLTADRLQQLVDCHIARAAALGEKMPAMTFCPLALPGVVGVVFATGDGLEVTVASDDPTTAREVLWRAQALVPTASERQMAQRQP